MAGPTTAEVALAGALNIPLTNFVTSHVPIRYFQKEFEDGLRTLDSWQRLDGWSGKGREDYKSDFIKAILHGNDIPKIMEYTLLGDESQKKRILDGGHRTRAIHEFKTGEFSVKLEGNYYWWTVPDPARPERDGEGRNKELPQSLKNRFEEYSLTVTTYKDLTDAQARQKFNELNHCRPMNTPEVINSHASLLIDYLRKEWSNFIDDPDSDDYKGIQKLFNLTKKDLDKLNHMKVMVSLFALIDRNRNGDVFDYCQPGDALKYVRASDDAELNTQFSRSEFLPRWRKFTTGMENYAEWYEEITNIQEEGNDYEFSLTNHSEALTFFHYINSLPALPSDEDNEKIFEFSEKCNKFKKMFPKLNKELDAAKRGSLDAIAEVQEKLDALETEVGDQVVAWLGSFKNNGSGKTNMKKRHSILRELLH
tara:strand:+ start:2991 stop:4259 length:1269 start_codon:yes stop_codon:yes gene_type:complete